MSVASEEAAGHRVALQGAMPDGVDHQVVEVRGPAQVFTGPAGTHAAGVGRLHALRARSMPTFTGCVVGGWGVPTTQSAVAVGHEGKRPDATTVGRLHHMLLEVRQRLSLGNTLAGLGRAVASPSFPVHEAQAAGLGVPVAILNGADHVGG